MKHLPCTGPRFRSAPAAFTLATACALAGCGGDAGRVTSDEQELEQDAISETEFDVEGEPSEEQLPASAESVEKASPTTTFSGSSSFGSTLGGFIWFNRAVGVQGSVTDFSTAGTTTVLFDFYQDSVYLSTQTRTVNGSRRDFNFTEAAPQGGITYIEVYLCQLGFCEIVDFAFRP